MNKPYAKKHAERRKKQFAYIERKKKKVGYSCGHFFEFGYLEEVSVHGAYRKKISREIKKKVRRMDKDRLISHSEENKMFKEIMWALF